MEDTSLDDIYLYRITICIICSCVFAIIMCFFQRYINEKFDIKSEENYKFFSKKMWLKDIDKPFVLGAISSTLNGIRNIEFELLEKVGFTLLIFFPLYALSSIIAKVLYKLYRKRKVSS